MDEESLKAIARAHARRQDTIVAEMIEHLDFETPCQWIKSEADVCGRPAAWKVLCVRCEFEVGFLCDGHLTVAQVFPVIFQHDRCGIEGTIAEIARFLPLERV